MKTQRWRLFLTVGAACVPAALYVLYVWHYSVNLPFADDWSKATLVFDARRGHLDLGAMWEQHNEGRLLIPNLIFWTVGQVDRFNLRAVVGLSAMSFAAGYFLMLLMFRTYTARPLTPIPVLSLGVIWFSLASTGNSLWAFQLAWYLVIFFLALMLYFLLEWPHRRGPSVALAILAAVGGTVSMLHGFVLWPVGLICLLWTWERKRAHVVALVAWLAAALLTLGVYVHQYALDKGCSSNANCSLVPRHPVRFARFFSALVGYVVPKFGPLGRQYFGFHQLLGVALLAATTFVIVQSLRERRHTRRPPLAPALIVFALLFDLTIALGRGDGRVAVAAQSRFTMPNVLLVVGLAVYAWAHAPNARRMRKPVRRRDRLRVAAFVVLAAFVVSQAIFTTETGIDEGRTWHRIVVTEARVLANLDRISKPQQLCYLSVFVTNGVARRWPPLTQVWLPRIALIKREALYVYERDTYRRYRAIGPPNVPGVCAIQSATNITPQGGS